MFYGVPVWIIPGLLRAISAEALGTRLLMIQISENLLNFKGPVIKYVYWGGGGYSKILP